MQEEPITECGSRPSGRSSVSRSNSVDPGRQTTCAPCRIRCTPRRRRVEITTTGRS
jgi:hypothetical protein